ncbi:hypothetical protein KFZ76_02600 [Methylovulum psychrotolerans]|uniref:hypothetical protein n=1 Tax=Methylovulum psychrotolerans TaxID=1704499 RepID=UPI001BFFCF1E|nr:hypothetical protein [Methylovulum psychrotolerans]MBT9096601.1 hypothetical protein [Methylovulum psychrotolerans]
MKKYLLEDVSLSNIRISGDGRKFNIEFINLYDGGFLAELVLESVMIFNYNNNFYGDDDGFPVYIGELTCRELTIEEACLEFKFSNEYMTRIFPKGSVFLIGIKSGQVSIDIACSDYSLK